MKQVKILAFVFLTSLLQCQKNFAQNNNSLLLAESFILSLKEKAKLNNQATNQYIITDIDNDGEYEIIVKINNIENLSPGFLPIELSDAFEYHEIYNCVDNSYKVSKQNFRFYHQMRNFTHKTWLFRLQNTEGLSQNLKLIIKSNTELLIKELNRLIDLTSY